PKDGRFIDSETGELREDICGADFDTTPVRRGVFERLFEEGARAIHEKATKAATPDAKDTRGNEAEIQD
ncbi:MAG: hypothetical protein WC269_00600, partial [Candidatus Gracilibacteria bacterium]